MDNSTEQFLSEMAKFKPSPWVKAQLIAARALDSKITLNDAERINLLGQVIDLIGKNKEDILRRTDRDDVFPILMGILEQPNIKKEVLDRASGLKEFFENNLEANQEVSPNAPKRLAN